MTRQVKIFRKYFLITAVVIAISLSFMMALLTFFINRYFVHEKYDTLQGCCSAITEMSTDRQLSESNMRVVMSYLAPLVTRTNDATILLTDKDGVPQYCSCDIFRLHRTCEHVEKTLPSYMVEKAAGDEEFYELSTMGGILAEKSYIYGTTISYQNSRDHALIFSFSPASTIRLFLFNVFRMFLLASVVTLIVMFFAVYYVSYRLTKPLRLMSEAAGCMAKGDFSRRIPVTSDDEVGELAVAFNNMTNSLVNLESTRRSFIANVSHELKTPMTTIGGFIDGIIDGTIPKEREGEYLQIVSSEIKRLSRLVQSMLNLAKLESGEMRVNITKFNIASMTVETVLSQQQRIEDKKINIVGLDKLEPIKITADQDLIHQVVYNLVDNAVKFTPEGGTITFSNCIKDNKMYFSIRNSGRGIEAKDLPYIFERFYKTDRSRSAVKDSTGLGLYIVKTIINIHHGRITVKSVLNEYTEFEFRLPCEQ